jgi:Ca2+-dependent lipid-binding protein
MKEKEIDNKMYWYHWIAVYAIIIAAFAFWVIPEKSLLSVFMIIVIGVSGYLVIAYLPRKDMKDL